jgi:hypothetical protein
MNLIFGIDAFCALIVLFAFGALPEKISLLRDEKLRRQMWLFFSVTGLVITLVMWVYSVRESIAFVLVPLGVAYAYFSYRHNKWLIWFVLLAINILMSASLSLRPTTMSAIIFFKCCSIVVAILVWRNSASVKC